MKPGRKFVSPPNVLFSTTRMWNCGDDFILFGVRELIGAVVPQFNAVVYNRNPEFHVLRLYCDKPVTIAPGAGRPGIRVNLYETLKGNLWQHEDSWRPGGDLSAMDYCVFAGTPEWFGPMVSPLVDALLQTEVPVAYVGIGVWEGNKDRVLDDLPEADQELLRRAKLVTVRDSACARMLAPLDPLGLPCPALFAAPHQRVRNKKERLALSLQGVADGNNQRIAPQVFEYAVALFGKLAEKYECALVCHYVEELYELKEVLGDRLPFLYCYDSKDYLDIYDRFDLTVTTRVHGAGLCASLGIPGIALAHSARSETVDGFLTELIQTNDVPVAEAVERIDALPIRARSEEIVAHKAAARKKYLDLLGRFFATGDR